MDACGCTVPLLSSLDRLATGIAYGLVGFARLVTGDVFDVSLKYGAQKWKTRCKIGPLDQSCDPQGTSFKVLLVDIFIVKVLEMKALGRSVLLGEKRCDTKDLFSARTQSMTISLNASGSVKLGLVVHWNPLDGAEESSPLPFDSSPFKYPIYSPKLSLPSTPSTRQQQQQQQQQSHLAQAPISRHSSDNSRVMRYSMPLFPPAFNALSPDFIPSFLSQSPLQRSPALSSVESDDGRRILLTAYDDDSEDVPISLGGFIPRVCYGQQASVNSDHTPQRPRSAVEINRTPSDLKIDRWRLNDSKSSLKPDEAETDFRFMRISSRLEECDTGFNTTASELDRGETCDETDRNKDFKSMSVMISNEPDSTDLDKKSVETYTTGFDWKFVEPDTTGFDQKSGELVPTSFDRKSVESNMTGLNMKLAEPDMTGCEPDTTSLNRISSLDCRETDLVEDALEAFSFLDSDDCLESSKGRTEETFVEGGQLCNQRSDSTTLSTDSGIASLAHRLNSDSMEF